MASTLALGPSADIWAPALLMVKRYKEDAMTEASAHADQLLEDGQPEAAANWHPILNETEQLQAKAPAEGDKVH